MADSPAISAVQEEQPQAAEVVADYLPSGYAFDGAVDDGEGPGGLQSSLRLQGGDIHRDLYKIDARNRPHHQRAKTFSVPGLATGDTTVDMSISEQLIPGGFRRQYVQQKYGDLHRLNPRRVPVARNFVEFLDLYGNFAGEDLEESDSDEPDTDTEAEAGDGGDGERRPLLGRRKSTKRRAQRPGDAGVTRTFFTLLKAFIGTGIMFLPKAFQNGGIVFSSITLLSVALITTLAFHLLLKCKAKYSGGYGELGEAIGGRKMRAVILSSITISQLGFVCAGTVFVADNLKSFADAVSPPSNPSPLSTRDLIALQLIILVPMGLIRNISKLGPAAMIADVFIVLGLVYIWWYDIAFLSSHGIAESVVLFNPDYYTLTIGAAIFTFEGIGLILPIQSSMAQPEKFEYILYVIMALITLIFSSVGILCYATFGSDTKIEVISNFPQTSRLVNAVQFVYSMAVLVGTPVQLFPAVRILEAKLFGNLSGKHNVWGKWKKNAFRTFIVLLCIAVSIAGSANLDRFVALIGSFACVPLVYIYPPLLHYKGVATNKWVKAGDVVFIVGGLFAMVYTTAVTVVNSFLQ